MLVPYNINARQPGREGFMRAMGAIVFGGLLESVTARFPKEMLRELEELASKSHVDRSEVIRRLVARALFEIRKEEALEAYSKGRVTLWKAAEMSGVSLREIMDLARRSQVLVPYGPEEVERDIAHATKKDSG